MKTCKKFFNQAKQRNLSKDNLIHIRIYIQNINLFHPAIL